MLETVGVRDVLTLSTDPPVESLGSGGLTAAVVAELVVEVVSAQFRLAVVVVVSVGFVSLEEVEGEDTSTGMAV